MLIVCSGILELLFFFFVLPDPQIRVFKKASCNVHRLCCVYVFQLFPFYLIFLGGVKFCVLHLLWTIIILLIEQPITTLVEQIWLCRELHAKKKQYTNNANKSYYWCMLFSSCFMRASSHNSTNPSIAFTNISVPPCESIILGVWPKRKHISIFEITE